MSKLDMTPRGKDRNLSWEPKVFRRCTDCRDIVYSRYEGEYRRCSCGNIAIDETQYYCRYIGSRGEDVSDADILKLLKEKDSGKEMQTH